MEPKIEFRMVRDFGEIINDTFIFIKQNFKPLLISLIWIAGIFTLVSMAATVIQQLKASEVVRQGGNPLNFGVTSIIAVFISYLNVFVMTLVVFCYMAAYQENDKQAPGAEQVWNYVRYYFFRFLLACFLFGMLMLLGMAFCLLPGVYLWPVVSLMTAAVVLENGGITYSFDRGFKLIKEQWWVTFATFLIVSIIYYAGVMVIALPMSVAAGASFFVPSADVSTPLLIAYSVLTHICQLFIAVPTVAIGLTFYSLVERKENAGLMHRIQTFGTAKPTGNQPEEEF